MLACEYIGDKPKNRIERHQRTQYTRDFTWPGREGEQEMLGRVAEEERKKDPCLSAWHKGGME